MAKNLSIQSVIQVKINTLEGVFDMSSKSMIFLKGYAQGNGMKNTLRAIRIAEKYHAGQLRKTGEPYIDHPTQVACELLALGVTDDATIAAALLHDVLEDCNVTVNQLHHDYHLDEDVLDTILRVTKRKEDSLNIYYSGITTWRSILLKLSDRCHNISTMVGGFSNKKMREYIAETNEYVLPLCKIGLECFPDYDALTDFSNKVFVMKYHIQSMTKTISYLLDDMQKNA